MRSQWAGRRHARWHPGARIDGQLLISLVIVACLLAYYGYRQWNAAPQAAIVGKAWVIDGDTIEISGTRIRLDGIDAPEQEQTCTDVGGKAWACGRAATRELRGHIRGRELRCNARAFDRFGRVLGVCLLPDGSDVNAWLVQQGWAVAYGFDRAYASEEAAAESAKRGIWAGGFEQPAQWRHRHSQ
jgi:endonuclease YncB( thermonuclease family)